MKPPSEEIEAIVMLLCGNAGTADPTAHQKLAVLGPAIVKWLDERYYEQRLNERPLIIVGGR